MPALQFEGSLAAGATNGNVFSGSAFEFARSRQVVSIGMTAAATGTFAAITSGSDVILEDSPTYIKTQFPIVPDEMFYNDVMEVGDRLRVSFRNPSGGAIVCRSIALMASV